MTDIVGIDLGTTNSEIAIYRDGRAEVLADETGRMILPSVVGIAPDGTVLVGEEARNQLLLHPDRTVRSIKRRMGRDETVRLADQEFTPQEISGIILKRLKAIAEHRLGHPVEKAVITVPAYFSDTQRQATREAGSIAGLDVVRIINEPTAAALAYEAGRHQGKRLLVYDLGGGTFDVSVVRIEDGVVEVISSHGNNHLGGDDFDDRIVTHILDHLRATHGADLSHDARAMARIRRAGEAAKIHLSDNPFAVIEEEYLAEHQGTPLHLSLELERTVYEDMIAPFVEETLEAIHIALKGAELTSSQVEEILLVGGATRTPLIRGRLREIFNVEPRADVNPELCVAVGASVQGAAADGRNVSAVLVDVTPYTFGTSAVGELNGDLYPYVFAPIIRKNTPIPVRRSEAFRTIHDDQTEVDVRIYQGEDPDAVNNVRIGEFRVEGLSAVPAGNIVIIDLALDRDGILHVSAREKATGLEQRITIDKAVPRYGEADLDSARGRISALLGEEAPPVPTPAVAAGEETASLLSKARQVLDRIGPEDRDDLVDLIEEVEDAAAAGDAAALADSGARLVDLLFFLET